MSHIYNKLNAWTILAVLMAFMLAASLFTVFRYGDYFNLKSDDERYVQSAVTLLDKGMLTYHDQNTPSVYIMPGHPVLLAAFIKAAGMDAHKGVMGFRAFQAVLQALSLLLIFLIGRELFNSITALLACMLDAAYIPEITSSGLILTEVEFKFLLLLLSYISIRAFKSKDLKLYILAGFIWGLACLFRPTIATYPLVVFIMWLLYRYTLKEMLKYGLVVSVVFCVVMAPWWIRNYAVFDRFIPLTLSSGNPFLQGTYIDYDQSVDRTPYRTKDLQPFKAGTDAITTNEVEMETGKYRFITYLKKDPLKYIYWYTIGKTKYMWDRPYYWRTIFRIPGTAVRIYHFALLAASLLGIAFILKRRHLSGFLPLLLILYMNLMHLPYFTFSRYAYPVMPMVILLAAYGLTAAAAQAIVSRPAGKNTIAS